MLPTTISKENARLFALLADGVIHETSYDDLKEYIPSDISRDKVEEYIKKCTKPSETPGFEDEVIKIVCGNPLNALRSFVLLMMALDTRLVAPALTGTTTLIREMNQKQKEQLLKSWRDSPIGAKNKLFKTVCSLSIAIFLMLTDESHFEIIGYPRSESKEKLYESQEIDPFEYSMMDKPLAPNAELYLPEFDALIIGSGCGAGVVAHSLAEEGFKSLVLEKGKYFRNSELNFKSHEGFNNLYETGGKVATLNQQTMILAGSNFGGGSTVNWSACLKTPFKVRKEWYEDFGVEWAASDLYDKCTDYIWKRIGATTEGVKHSFPNKTLLEGAEKLDYKCKPIEQNIGGHANHSCGYCFLGCKFGVKQGSVNCWFKLPHERGSKFMDQVKVLRIIHKDGKAEGVLCEDKTTGNLFTIRGPRKIIVSGGSLNTPVILQNSGFKNKHIGSNLKLHPVTVLFGDFGKDIKVDSYKDSIMTAVCTEVDDIDGKAHGAKIETILNVPDLSAAFLPWESSTAMRKNLLRYNHLTPMLIITRDKSSGSVRGDPNKPDALIVDYEVNKFDRNALLQGILACADILYIQGAKEIIHPQYPVPSFKSDKPKLERSITDKDYVAWRERCAKSPLSSYGPTYGSAHQMSSCRIASSPKYGACDLKGRLYECKNIYVADASSMPTASGANPMVTTLSISRLISTEIIKDLKSQAKL